MKQKANPGLIATNSDGKPSVRPPIPAGWCRSTSIPSGINEAELVSLNGGNNNLHLDIMSAENGHGDPSPQEADPRGATGVMMNSEDLVNNREDVDSNMDETHSVKQSGSIPPDSAVVNNEDSNVDVEIEEQRTPEGDEQSMEQVEVGSSVDVVSDVVDSDRNAHDEDSTMSDAQYIEKQVVESFLHTSSRPHYGHGEVVISSRVGVCKNGNTASASGNKSSVSPDRGEKIPAAYAGQVSNNRDGGGSKRDKYLDPVSMTIASVAAGEGEPPEFLTRTPQRKHEEEEPSPYHHSMPSANKHKKNRMDKGMSASARLPVISSLLAPSGAVSLPGATLPGIQHIAASSSRTSSSPTTVLPSVAHFLGPAKSPPTAYTPHHSGSEMYGTGLPPTANDSSDSGHTHYQAATGGHTMPSAPSSSSTSSKSKNSRKPVTPAGLRLSMAASEELPDPLPLPQYSDKVIRAKQLGTVAFDRPTVLRETVQFYLQFKHYWSSHDYDRISNLVIELFPEFKDASDTPGVPANKRIRTDLSMYARNFRRREVSQRKRESAGSSSGDVKTESGSSSAPSEAAVKSFLHSPSPSNSSGGPTNIGSNNNNAADFCNELLTAASIIESQNTSSGTRNGELAAAMTHNHHKVKVAESGSDHQGGGLHKDDTVEEEGRQGGVTSNQHHSREETPDDDDDDTPIHFVYDKDSMAAAASRDANTAWQMYSDQMAQAMATGNPGLDYGMSEEVTAQSSTDRLSAMAMWRSTALPDPLPTPPYSDSVIRARESGNTMSARPKIIRETTQFFLALKLWWTAPDYERIAELVLQNFPALVSLQAIKKDLGTCARNMRRRLPAAKYKATSTSQKPWNNAQTGLEMQTPDIANQSAPMAPGTAEYMKALMAAQNMNLTELGMTQRNLGELAVLAGIKQRIEQHPQEVTDLERQYLAQCSSEEQRQALMASGAFGNDSAAMAALSAFYNHLGMDISSGTKRTLGSSDYNTTSVHDSTPMAMSGPEALEVPNRRQRRISQAEVEKRLREAELSLSGSQQAGTKLHEVSVSVSDKNLVKREPMSPSGSEGQKVMSSNKQQLSVPNPANTPIFPTTSSTTSHEQAYWDAQAATNMALMGIATMAHSTPQQTATQAHSQAQIQHLPGHDPSANLTSTDAPMNLTYHESDKHSSHRQVTSDSPLPESLPDTAGLAAQVEVTTSSAKSHSPRRRASSSPRSSHQGDSSLSSRDQVWFPHGTGFKKENQDVVRLPEPLPVPSYSQKIVSAREDGTSMRHRSEIIRETARFFLGLKYWWSSADYTRISELVVQQFPALKDDVTADGLTNYRRIQRDLSMCARNLRRSKKPRKMREFSKDSSNSALEAPEPSRTSKNKNKSSKNSFSSSLDKKTKRSLASTSSSKAKKAKQAAAASVPEPSASSGVSEDMTAAAALLQQQFMQPSSASSYHPSAHLLPSSHLLPSLQTHPSLHEQQVQSQFNSSLMQHPQHHPSQEGHNITVEEPHSAKRVVKEEPSGQEAVDHTHAGVKSNPVAPMQRSSTPPMESSQSNMSELARHMSKSGHSHMREMDGSVGGGKDETEKLVQPQAPSTNSLKVYVDPDHGSDLQERFSTLWRKGKFFDASLGVANKKLHVHKLVLLAMSPYLQETFKNADPRSQLEVNLPSDTTYETAKAFLKYIYEGVLEVDTSSVRSLHKIATMLQMTKLAQYCQNFAQQLQEEADQASGVGGEGEIAKISVNLGELQEMQAQRQRLLEAQALQRLGETNSISSSDLPRTATNRYTSDEHSQFKAEYLAAVDQNSSAQTPHFLHQDVLAQHRALVATSSSGQPTTSSSLLLPSPQDVATQQIIQAALARHQTSSPPSSAAATSSSMYQQHHQHLVAQSDANAVLLHRLTSPDVSSAGPGTLSTSSLDHQQRIALAAYWQAHTLGELMSRNQTTGLTSDSPNMTSASDLAAMAAASTSEDSRHLLPDLGHEVKLKTPSVHSRSHPTKEPSWGGHGGETDCSHQATMLPETCIPADMARSHHVTNSEGNS